MREQMFVIEGRLDGMNTIIDTNRSSLKSTGLNLTRAGIPITSPPEKKFIFDALQETGVLRNDSMKEIWRIEESFGVDSDCPRIVVLIREVF